MKNVILGAAVLIAAGCAQSSVGDSIFADGEVQHVVRATEITWGPCPPNMPSGCEIAVLEGDPRTPDLFTGRFKVPAGFIMPPHTHPGEERVTVLSGRVAVAFGEEASRDEAPRFGPGDYYVNARDVIHSVWTDGPSVIQITGIGPWEARFLEP